MEKSDVQQQKSEFTNLCRAYQKELRAFRDEATDVVIPLILSRPTELSDAIFIRDFMKRLRTSIINFSYMGGAFPDVLALTPWKTTPHFSHNIGTTPILVLGRSVNEFINAMWAGTVSQHSFQALDILIQNLPFFIDQLIAHLESAYIFLTDSKESEEVDHRTKLVDAFRVVLRARVLYYGGIKIPGISENYLEDVPSARALCDASIESDLPLEELVEMFYVLTSNSHRTMSKQEHPENHHLEVTGREIEYEGTTCIVAEFFNTGPLVDINALSRKILNMPNHATQQLDAFRPVLNAIKQGSKQARLDINEDMLILEGITLVSGGSGIGLNDLNRHVTLRGGVLLLNNVYGEEEGFCVTLILPKWNVPPNGMNSKLRELKDLLQTGEYFLPKVEMEAEMAADLAA